MSQLVLVSLFVRDLETSRAFYVDLLGMEVVQRLTGDNFIFLRSRAGTPIALRPKSGDTAEATPPSVAFELAFEVDDVDATRQDWISRGVPVLSEIEDIGAGRMFLARDPDGNTIGVSQLHEPVRQYRASIGL